MISGWESFCADPGTVTHMSCKVCCQVMHVDRNHEGPRTFAGSCCGISSVFDHFYCENHDEDWHIQARDILIEAKETSSLKLEQMLVAEAEEIITNRVATK